MHKQHTKTPTGDCDSLQSKSSLEMPTRNKRQDIMCAQRPKGNSKENNRLVFGVIQKNSCTCLRILKFSKLVKSAMTENKICSLSSDYTEVYALSRSTRRNQKCIYGKVEMRSQGPRSHLLLHSGRAHQFEQAKKF